MYTWPTDHLHVSMSNRAENAEILRAEHAPGFKYSSSASNIFTKLADMFSR
jgi:hypothetical protein